MEHPTQSKEKLNVPTDGLRGIVPVPRTLLLLVNIYVSYLFSMMIGIILIWDQMCLIRTNGYLVFIWLYLAL